MQYIIRLNLNVILPYIMILMILDIREQLFAIERFNLLSSLMKVSELPLWNTDYTLKTSNTAQLLMGQP